MLLEQVYTTTKVANSGKIIATVVNAFIEQFPVFSIDVDKIIKETEEDRSIFLATIISLLTGKPLTMARCYPYSPSEINSGVEEINPEHFKRQVYLNNVAKDGRDVIGDSLEKVKIKTWYDIITPIKSPDVKLQNNNNQGWKVYFSERLIV